MKDREIRQLEKYKFIGQILLWLFVCIVIPFISFLMLNGLQDAFM